MKREPLLLRERHIDELKKNYLKLLQFTKKMASGNGDFICVFCSVAASNLLKEIGESNEQSI